MSKDGVVVKPLLQMVVVSESGMRRGSLRQSCRAMWSEWAVRRSVRQTVVRDKQMKTLGMATGREIDPSKSPDSLWDIWCQTHEKQSIDEAAYENQPNKQVWWCLGSILFVSFHQKYNISLKFGKINMTNNWKKIKD